MKKLALILVLLLLLLSACGPSNEKCESAWEQLDVPAGEEGTHVNLILNNEWAPDSVGFTLKECIQSGWDYR